MPLLIGIVMDPIESINYKKDTSLALLWAAKDAGHELWYITPEQMFQKQGRSHALMRPLDVFKDPDHFYTLGDAQDRPLADLDAILMRKDPPFDMNFVYATYFLENAAKEGTLIVNNPQSLRDCNEKLFATQFPELCPELVVSSQASVIKAFHESSKDTIIKPLDGMGGTGIFRVKGDDGNINVIIEMLSDGGKTPVMAQTYLPEIKLGDKRILIVDGEGMPYCLARIPSQGETRGNLAAGGRGVAQPLSDTDREIAEQIAPVLVEKGLLFVGVDVIGAKGTEINVTSHTRVREIEASFPIDIAAKLITAIEKRCN